MRLQAGAATAAAAGQLNQMQAAADQQKTNDSWIRSKTDGMAMFMIGLFDD